MTRPGTVARYPYVATQHVGKVRKKPLRFNF
jgi:hypothetical protein